jgi:hypothetical protein
MIDDFTKIVWVYGKEVYRCELEVIDLEEGQTHGLSQLSFDISYG